MNRREVFPNFYAVLDAIRWVRRLTRPFVLGFWRLTRPFVLGFAFLLLLAFVVANVKAGRALEAELRLPVSLSGSLQGTAQAFQASLKGLGILLLVAVLVTPVNDAPVLTAPATANTNEETILTFSASNGNRISIADLDAAASPIKVTVTDDPKEPFMIDRRKEKADN